MVTEAGGRGRIEVAKPVAPRATDDAPGNRRSQRHRQRTFELHSSGPLGKPHGGLCELCLRGIQER
jgi:hypothetical protein